MTTISNKTLQPTISVIVPAYNEEKGIRRVLDVLLKADFLTKIIVIDDGSRDKTKEIVQRYCKLDNRIELCEQERNLGKGQAIHTGLLLTDADIIVTLDADLINLRVINISDLVTPIIEKRADVTLGIFHNGRWYTDLAHYLTPWLTGQRCIRRELFGFISWDAAKGYGFETAITIAIQRHGWVCTQVRWFGVTHPSSESHRGIFQGIKMRSKMYLNIIRAWLVANWFHEKTIKDGKYLKGNSRIR